MGALGAAGLLTAQAAAPGLAAAAGTTAPPGTASAPPATATAPPATASAPPATVPAGATFTVGQLGLGTVMLNGKVPARTVTAALPAAWSGARAAGRLVVAATGVRPGEMLRVFADGAPVGEAPLHAGVQDVTFSTGALRAGAISFRVVATGGRRATDAKVTIDPSSTVSVHRTGLAKLPPLSALPGALADPAAAWVTPLTVALPAHPSGDVLRAAMTAAGAVAKADGAPGVRAFAELAPSPAELASTNGPVLAVDERPGTARLAVSYLPSGQLQLTLSGSGDALQTAARLLSTPWMRSLNGHTATVPGNVSMTTPQPPSSPAQEPVLPAHATGSGTLKLASTFQLPVDRVITNGKATLRVGINYDSPTGGRVRIALNGNTLGAYNASAQGRTLHVVSYKLSSNWTDGGNLLPGFYLQPGSNRVTVTASPQGTATRSATPQHLSLAPGSGLALDTVSRPSTEQLALFPFPLYGPQGWTRTTVVLPRRPDAATLGALITAMANTERITGQPADPAVTSSAPTAGQRSGNLLVVGNPGTLAGLAYSGPSSRGVLAESRIPYGGVALIAFGAQALGGIGQGYEPNTLNGRAVLIDAHGRAHTLLAAPAVSGFGTPTRPWLKPAALLALLALGWIVVRIRESRKRLDALPDMQNGDVPVSS
jgi:hypothetical protein